MVQTKAGVSNGNLSMNSTEIKRTEFDTISSSVLN